MPAREGTCSTRSTRPREVKAGPTRQVTQACSRLSGPRDSVRGKGIAPDRLRGRSPRRSARRPDAGAIAEAIVGSDGRWYLNGAARCRRGTRLESPHAPRSPAPRAGAVLSSERKVDGIPAPRARSRAALLDAHPRDPRPLHASVGFEAMEAVTDAAAKCGPAHENAQDEFPKRTARGGTRTPRPSLRSGYARPSCRGCAGRGGPPSWRRCRGSRRSPCWSFLRRAQAGPRVRGP